MAVPSTPENPTYLSLFSFLLFFFLFFFPSLSQSRNASYDTCAPFTCGNITNVTFPFFSSSSSTTSDLLSCGLYSISCERRASRPTISLSDRPYQLKSLSPSDRLMVVSDILLVADLGTGDCSKIQKLSLPPSHIAPLTLPQWGIYLNFYRCPPSHSSLGNFVERVQDYSEQCKDGNVLYLARNYSDLSSIEKEIPSVPSGCVFFQVPVTAASLIHLTNNDSFFTLRDLNWTNLLEVLGKGLWLQWGQVDDCTKCNATGGRCGFERASTESDASSGRLVCLPREASQRLGTG